VVDENIGIFNSEQNTTLVAQPQILRPEPFIEERRALFLEDLKTQLQRSKPKNSAEMSLGTVTEDQLLQMYYSSAGAMNQTAQFDSTLVPPPLPSTSVFQKVEPNLPPPAQSVQRKPRPPITDENGELDEFRCLQALMTPQLSTVTIGKQPPQKCFVMLAPADTFYTELTESYLLRVTRPDLTILQEVPLDAVESVVMKNIVQKQFVVQWRGDNRVAIETADQSDRFFIALNFVHERAK